MRESATAKNTRITYLADIIQRSRSVLADSNPTLCFSEKDTRRIVLVCLLYLRVNESKELLAKTYDDVLTDLKVSYGCSFSLDATTNTEIIDVRDTICTLGEVKKEDNWKELLIYSFESMEYDVESYFSVKKNRGVRSTNTKKKNQGIYYTPNDVVSFMVSSCVTKLVKRTSYPSVIDCSCGSGVFLLRYLEALENEYNINHKIENSIQILNKCIWGVDISSAAIDSCITAFIQYYVDHYFDAADCFDYVWVAIRNCFFVGDGTNLQAVIYSNNGLPQQFDCIIGNPPYVTKGKSENLFMGFVDNMMQYSSDCGLSSLILPLSICYAQGGGYSALRERIQADCAIWDFLNYDRSPDSLFGDQVKTRNTILFRDVKSRRNAIHSSHLQRWTSEKRNQLFDNIDLCDISDYNITNGVPKISGIGTFELFKALHDGTSCAYDLISKDSDSPATIVINGTAYNWLCIYDHLPPSVDENGDGYVSGTTKVYTTEDNKAQYFCIALLSNRIAYWYWSAIGDGFHLNSSFLKEFHIGKADFTEKQFDELCSLGQKYCSIAKQHPTVSYNAGKKIVNYSHWEAMGVVQEIETLILAALNLPTTIGSQIANWYDNQVHCNR
jgi:hypothetical protein